MRVSDEPRQGIVRNLMAGTHREWTVHDMIVPQLRDRSVRDMAEISAWNTRPIVMNTRPIVIMTVLMVVIGCTAACSSSAGSAGSPSSHSSMQMTDWGNLKSVDSPNKWLVAPADSGIAGADQVAPQWQVNCAVLTSNWQAVIEHQPRTEILAMSTDGLQMEARQRSAFFGFVDLISSRAVPLGNDMCALAIYSRSTVGYWDFGVNRRRVETWLKDLDRRIASADFGGP